MGLTLASVVGSTPSPTVHYRAWLAENGEVFMETKKETSNSEPVTLVAGRGTILFTVSQTGSHPCDTDTSFRDVGINLAVGTMRVGEVARVFVHPKYGYGEKGSFSFPTVPPNADLVYELELLAFENANQEVVSSGIANATMMHRYSCYIMYTCTEARWQHAVRGALGSS